MNKKYSKRAIIIFLILFTLLVIFAFSALADRSHQYYGYATEEGNPNKVIEDGTTITACVYKATDSYWYNQTTTVNNSLSGKNYYINLIPPDSPEPNGCPIYWYIGTENSTNDSGFQNLVINWPAPPNKPFWNLTIIDAPQLTDNTIRNGTTGDLFIFNVTVIDYVDSPAELTVNVSWSHNGSSGLVNLSNSVGDIFTGNITLGHNISDMIYTVRINDTSGHTDSTGPHSVNVTDNDPPVTSLAIGEPLHPDATYNNSNLTSSSTIYFNTTDNIGLYYIHYRIWNTTNGWSSWTVGSADTDLNISLVEEGKNYLEYYANDTAGNNETTHNVTLWVDDTAPTTTLTINEQVHPNAGASGCNITSSTTMYLSISDNPTHGSGVASTAYRYWNVTSGWTAWTAYSGGTFTLGSDEGKYYLEFNSTDNLSHAETSNNYTIWIDDTAPTTSIAIASPNYPSAIDGCNVTSATTFTLTAIDYPAHNASVAFSWYNDNGAYHLYGAPFTLSGEGAHVITYGSQDNLGNNETANTITVYLDDTAPTTTLTINEQVHPSSTDGCNVTSTTTMNLTASDGPAHNSSVASTAYRYWYNTSGWTDWTAYGGSNFSLGANEGKYYLEFNSTDNLGNAETSNNWTIWVDDTAPNSTITYNFSDYYYNTSIIITMSVNVSSEANGSGIKNVTLYYYYNNATNNTDKLNTSWGNPIIYSYNISDMPWLNLTNVTIYFNFSNGVGYYRFFSVATDNLTNSENTSIWANQTNSTECFFNTTAPNAPTFVSGSTSLYTNSDGLYRINATDVDNDRIKFGWDWDNDNVVDEWQDNDSAYYASEEIVDKSKSWSSAGTKSFKVRAMDEHGALSNWSLVYAVTVSTRSTSNNNNQVVLSLTADAGGPYTGQTGTHVTFMGSASHGSTPYSYSWDFDDGTTGTGETVEHSYALAGEYTVTLTVTDNDMDTANDEATVTITQSSVTSDPPTADAGGPYENLTYQNITFDGSGSTDDGLIENYTWDLDDGTILYGEKVAHSYNTSGLYNISLTVTDDDGLTDINTTTVTILLDTDADGWSDEMEESYNTSITDSEEHPIDTDGDGIPDEDSPDGKYTGDTDDDGDGISDEIEAALGSDPLSKETFTAVEIDGKTFYFIDTDGDGIPDRFVDESGKSYKFEVQSDGTILIDVDGDGEYDYVYDPASGTTESYEKEKEDELPLIPIIIIIVVVIILIIFFLFKKGYLYFEDKK